MEKFDLLVAGVGGQGVVLASDIIGETALAAGYDVKKTDTLGMAQRGGSVISHVRLGPKVWAPLIREGNLDLLVAFEKLEAVRFSHFLRRGGIAVINDYAQPPLSVSLGKESYPSNEEIEAALRRRTDRIYLIDGTAAAKRLGNIRTLNIYMIGCVSVFLPIDLGIWQENISRRLSENIRAVNLKAFAQGRKDIERVSLRQS